MAGMKLRVVLAIMVVASVQWQGTVAQTRHVVGDALGWTVPIGGSGAYTTWASQQTFAVGDVLFFNFTTGQHDVAEVSQAAYGPCTTTNPISLNPTGPATLTLTAPGTHYYICTFGTHCQIGQKLTINVSAATATPPQATPTAPSPPTLATPPSTSSPPPAGSTVPPPPSSAAPSFTAVVPVTFLAVALAFFY